MSPEATEEGVADGMPRVGLQLTGTAPTPLSWWSTTGAARYHPACILEFCQGGEWRGPLRTAG